MSSRYNGQFQVYKKQGALQASLIPYNTTSYKGGAILIEMAQCTDYESKKYNWAQKVNFALGINDLAQIFDGTHPSRPREFSLLHVPPGGERTDTKKMTFLPGEGNYAGTWLIKLKGSDGKFVQVPLSYGEMRIFQIILESCTPAIAGFDLSYLPRE